MSKITLSIDGVQVEVAQGTTILQAARSVDIYIPTLCHLEGISSVGSCRVCVVELEGQKALVSACNTKAADGMCVSTNSPRVQQARTYALQLIIGKHGLDSTNHCFSCVKNGSCELQDVCRDNGVVESPFYEPQPRKEIVDSNPFLRYDPNLCIQCQRCVGACNVAARNHSLGTGKMGTMTKILAPFSENWRTSQCESCGNCAQACPTGALTEKRQLEYNSWNTKRVRTTCPHCGVGCQLDLIVDKNRVVDARGANGPSNKGLLCVKGRSASFDFVSSKDRITTPLVKDYETGEFRPAGWDEALDLVATRFMQIKEEHGGEALAGFACSRATNEDVYLFQKMVRTCFGSNNVDNCARI